MSELSSALAREVRSGRPVLALTSGDSMRPLLDTGRTQVLIVRAEGDLKENDLPLYRRPTGQFVMHRIIRVDKEFYYARGDNRCGLERVPKDWVLGVVTEITRNGKTFPVSNRWYRRYVAAWNLIYPLRWAAYKLRGAVSKPRQRRKEP
ncbi:MAG: S24/S26 family peptidase [Clostridiales bacterium]|nr:S24/S26 family peptidase [Clostridiales bacterium]